MRNSGQLSSPCYKISRFQVVLARGSSMNLAPLQLARRSLQSTPWCHPLTLWRQIHRGSFLLCQSFGSVGGNASNTLDSSQWNRHQKRTATLTTSQSPSKSRVMLQMCKINATTTKTKNTKNPPSCLNTTMNGSVTSMQQTSHPWKATMLAVRHMQERSLRSWTYLRLLLW